MHGEPACNGVWIEGRDSSSQNQQRPAKSEQTEVAEGGQIPFWGDREMEEARGMRWCFGGEEVGVSDSSPPPARNNKQGFSYSNKYQASGAQGGASDKEEARGQEPDWRMAAQLHWSLFRITGRARRSKAGSDRFIMSVDSALPFNTRLKTY